MQRLPTRASASRAPLHIADLDEAGAHLAIPPGEMPRLLGRLGIDIDLSGPVPTADFGGRGLKDLGRIYLETLDPPVDADGFKQLRRDWRLLQLPTDIVDERIAFNAWSFLKKKRQAWLVRLDQLLPYDIEALRPLAQRFMREAHLRKEEERLSQLAPVKQAEARRNIANKCKDPDPRLDKRLAERLGCELQHVNALYELGMVELDPEAPQDGRRYARDPRSLHRDEIRERLHSNPPTLTPANVRFYRTARSGFGLDAFDDHAPAAVADVLSTFADQELVPSPGVMARVMGGDPQQFVDHLINHAIVTGKRIRWLRKWSTSTYVPTIEELADVIHPDAPVPLTAVDRGSGCPAQAPEPSIRQKVFSLDDPDDRTRAAIVALEGARIGIAFDSLARAMISLNALLPLMRGLDPSLPHHVDSVLAPYAFLSDGNPFNQRQRLDDVSYYKVALQVSDSWFGRLKPEQQATAARFRLAWPSGAATLFDSVSTRLCKIHADAEDDRDDRLAKWMDDPDRTMAFILQKADRTLAYHDTVEACLAYADAHLKSGEWDGEGPLHWLHDEAFADVALDGKPIDQRILFSIETWESKCARLRENGRRFPDPYKRFQSWLDTPQERLAHNGHGGKPDPDLNENRYAIAVHDVVPRTPGDPVSPPHWLAIFKGCVLDTGTRLSARMAAERAIAVKETGIHNLNLQMPSGLINYAGTEKRTIARQVREALGEVLVPVHELAHGTALAAFSASARYDLPERTGELAQTDLEEDSWDTYTDPDTKETYGIFQQLRKAHKKESDFIFSPHTLVLLTRVCSFASARLFSGGEWPSILPDPALARRGFTPSTYVVTDGRRILDAGAMSALFYILVGGIGQLKPHDVKHLLNAIARREGVPLEVRRRWNMHALSRSTETYGRPSKGEREEDKLLFLRIQQGRRAAIMAASGIMPPNANLPYVTRRETLNRQRLLAVDLATVFERHNRVDELEEQRAAIRNLDEQILALISGSAA